MTATLLRNCTLSDPRSGTLSGKTSVLVSDDKIAVAKCLAHDTDLYLGRMECAANPTGKHSHPARREPVRVG